MKTFPIVTKIKPSEVIIQTQPVLESVYKQF